MKKTKKKEVVVLCQQILDNIETIRETMNQHGQPIPLMMPEQIEKVEKDSQFLYIMLNNLPEDVEKKIGTPIVSKSNQQIHRDRIDELSGKK